MAITRIGNIANTLPDDSISNSKFTDIVNFKNIIINGDMSIAQRGTSATGKTSSGIYTVDRIQSGISSAGTWTQSQSTDVPTGQGFATSLKMDCTTALGSLGSSNRLQISQKFEGQNLQYLKKGTSSAESLTLSFWVKSNKTGTYICEIYDTDNTRHIAKSYTISSADTWEKKTITYAGDTSGALDNDNAESLSVFFWLVAGSDFTSGTLATSWASITNANRAAGQTVNLADSTSNYINITGVQLEAGTTASDFEFLPYDVNLRRCQRYCHRVQGISGDQKAIGSGFCSDTTRAAITVIHPVTMRAEPTITEASIEIAHGPSSASSVSLGGDTDETLNVSTLLLDADSGAPFTSGDGVRARIASSTSAFLQLDAEL